MSNYDVSTVEIAREFANWALGTGKAAQVVADQLNADTFYNPFLDATANTVYMVGTGGHIVVLGADYVYRKLA